MFPFFYIHEYSETFISILRRKKGLYVSFHQTTSKNLTKKESFLHKHVNSRTNHFSFCLIMAKLHGNQVLPQYMTSMPILLFYRSGL